MTKEPNEAARELGRRGGLKTKEKYGPEHYQQISKKGLAARKAKKAAGQEAK